MLSFFHYEFKPSKEQILYWSLIYSLKMLFIYTSLEFCKPYPKQQILGVIKFNAFADNNSNVASPYPKRQIHTLPN